MIRHSLLLFFRNIRQFKNAFFINLFGLSTGLACVILIYLWANDELGMDRFYPNIGRLYQVMDNETIEGNITTSGHTHDFLASVLKEEMPEVEYAATVTPRDFGLTLTLHTDQEHVKTDAKFAEEDFFKVFPLGLNGADPSAVLSEDINAAISSSLAHRLFGTTENVVGRTIEWQLSTLKQSVEVSAVFDDLPSNASERFDLVLTMSSFRKIINPNYDAANRDWNNVTPFHTYFTLKENADVAALNDRLANIIEDKTGKASSHRFFAQPFGDLYLYGHFENGVSNGGRIEYIRLFSVIAGFILLIACVNFINLFTAKASRRIREVGIKKAIGAQRRTLIFQYLGESMLMSVLSLLIALVIVQVTLPQFGQLAGKHLSLTFDTASLVIITCVTLFTGIFAGVYPAIYISGFQTAKILRGQLASSAGELWARRGLVIFQFTLSVVFIVCVLVLHRQVEFIQSRDSGFDRKNVMIFDSEGKVAETASTFLEEVKNIPGVVNASSMLGGIVNVSSGMPGGGTGGDFIWGDKKMVMNSGLINYDLIETLGMTIKEGRSFSRDFPADRDKVIFNEAAIRAMGITDPVGKIVNGNEVIGIVKDFHFASMHELITPYKFQLQPEAATTIVIRMEPGLEKQTTAAIERFYKSYNPGYAFNYHFIEDQYKAQYAGEERAGLLSKYSAGLAIIISCLGLFGLAVFTAERRKKEMSIRKVLGSTELQIVSLISRDFTRMVLASIVIGLPLSFMITSWWLEGFAYKIEISWWYFAVSAMLVILLTWLTVGAQTIKAARVNPADSLRSE